MVRVLRKCRHGRRDTRRDRGRRREKMFVGARNAGGWQDEPAAHGCGSGRCLASAFAVDDYLRGRPVRRLLHRLPMLNFLLRFPPRRRCPGRVFLRGTIGGAGINGGGCCEGDCCGGGCCKGGCCKGGCCGGGCCGGGCCHGRP